MSADTATLTEALWPASSAYTRATRAIALVIAGTALLAVAAQVRIPFYPVPFTMQTFIVLVVGLTYGPRLGGATVATYLTTGAAGAPVFAGFSAGAAVLSGPTAGYLWGMLAAAVALGLLAGRGWTRTRGRTLGAMLLGTFIIFTAGLGWLAQLVGWKLALETGLIPFLGSEAAKIGLAMATVPTAWRLARTSESSTDHESESGQRA